MDLTEEDAQSQLDEMMPMAEQLFGMTEAFLSKRASFLPHGAEMNNFDQVAYIAAAPEDDYTNAEEVLPLLHEGLRLSTKKPSTLAVGVCEHVFLGEDQQPNIKVLAEHKLGACFALYLPFKTRFLRKPTYGDLQIVQATPEVGGWSGAVANMPFG